MGGTCRNQRHKKSSKAYASDAHPLPLRRRRQNGQCLQYMYSLVFNVSNDLVLYLFSSLDAPIPGTGTGNASQHNEKSTGSPGSCRAMAFTCFWLSKALGEQRDNPGHLFKCRCSLPLFPLQPSQLASSALPSSTTTSCHPTGRRSYAPSRVNEPRA